MLRRLELPDLDVRPQSPDVEMLLGEAARRIDEFIEQQGRCFISSFVASDYRGASACLAWINEHRLAAGNAFCEWGSGFGVVAMLAALHGFDACGIEVEPRLVAQGEQLAADLAIPVQFSCGSAIPELGRKFFRHLEGIEQIDTDAPEGYDALGLALDDFDLVYVYPWPGEERCWEQLFDRHAAHGALLLTYHGRDRFQLRRRVRK